MKQISVTTLQEMKDNGYRLSASCNYCGRSEWLKLDKLIERLGQEYVVGGNEGFRRSLACTRCGRHQAQLTVHPR